MEHVSTLCAISTVGIAATGFALGRVERAQSLDPTHTQHAPSPAADTTPSFDARVSNPVETAGIQSPVNSKFLESRGDAAPYTNLGGESAPRKSSFAGIRLRRRGQTLTIPPLRTEERPPTSSHGRRPSSSWIRRLSFQPDKRSSLQNPDTPSFTEPASPASPGFSRTPSQRRAPNKLVKRPKSQHSSANPFFAHTVSSPLAASALRRPATSYQRSETFKHKPTHSLSFEPSLALAPLLELTPCKQPSGNDPWQPYLAPCSDCLPDQRDRRFSTSTKFRDQVVRRIIPQTDTAPALLLATAITKNLDSVKAESDTRSASPPVKFRDPFNTDAAQTPQLETSPPETKTCQPSSEETCPKSPAEPVGPLDIRAYRDGAFTGPKRRAVSTPLPELANVEGAVWVTPRAPERRNITDPNVFRRPSTNPNSELPGLFSSGVIGPQSKVVADQHRYREIGQRVSTDNSALSSLYGSIRRRPKRHSIAASDPASTVIGSDDTGVFTSGDEDETDFMTDTAFDSICTHITTDSACFQSPRIESIFDRTLPPSISDEPPTRSNGITSPGSRLPPPVKSRDSDVELELNGRDSLKPVTQSLVDVHEGDSEISFPSDLSDDEDSQSMVASLPGDKTICPSQTLAKFGGLSLDTTGNHAQGTMDTHHALRGPAEHESNGIDGGAHNTSPRMNIFDWSEQSKSDREGSGPDGRPRTVHGKNGRGMRGSRAIGRKPSSTLHYRSQSVPVARETTASNESRQSSGKFGTWGLGSKGVSEDWDSDFEFEDKDKNENTMSENVNPNKDAGRRGVFVPKAIMERQASLHGQFGQVQELTLLVAELKRLRHQASFLDIVRGPSNELWKEAEGIVDLATLDDDDNNQSPPRSPSSLTFSFDESEGDSSQLNDHWKRISGDSWKASISENSSTQQATSTCLDQTVVSTKANSVLDLIYQQRLSHDPTTMNSHLPRSKKLPFDTQSLHDLVARAGAVTRALKEVVRKAEGVPNGSEENTHPSQPPFSRIFEHPSHDDLSKFETCIS
ncbi:uncharacterized protein BDV17DRAFT_59198 [Aspergillus undulatus]|uniref:uncharacterized protein n=1 Tax=Aspergillus undulatus TaxID=1810928 RepID=UPI003CCDF06F